MELFGDLYVDCVCTFLCLPIVDGSMSACEEDCKYYEEVEFLQSDGLIRRKVRSLLNSEKSTDNIIDARQTIHPCIFLCTHVLLTCIVFQSSIIYVLHVSSKSYGYDRNLPPH